MAYKTLEIVIIFMIWLAQISIKHIDLFKKQNKVSLFQGC